MRRLSFRREKSRSFKHIAPGLVPAASIAPKAAVPRTPPPRSPAPSPERHRSALAAAILSSSLTGQTWALPPARPRSFSETERSESFSSEPVLGAGPPGRGGRSEEVLCRPPLSSPESSEEEEEEEDGGNHIYQSLDSQEELPLEPLYSLPMKPESSSLRSESRSGRRTPSPERTEVSDAQPPEPCTCSITSKTSMKKISRGRREEVPDDPAGRSWESERPARRETDSEDRQSRLEDRLQRLERSFNHSKASSFSRPSPAGAELQNLRQQAQELVDENHGLKLTVHRLSVELSCYQARFRQLSKQELDMKYLSPLVLAYEDRMKEKDELLQATQEEVKRLRLQTQEVIRENEKLHREAVESGGDVQEQNLQLHQQARLVLQENQVLMDQLEEHQLRAEADRSRHQTEVSKLSKQLMLLEVEQQGLQEELQESQKEVQQVLKELQSVQARLKDSVTFEEHCSITGKLRRRAEQQQSRSKSQAEELRLRVAVLQEETRLLALAGDGAASGARRLEAELELSRRDSRKLEQKACVLKQQRDQAALREEKTRRHLENVMAVADLVSKERDQLLHMALVLQQEKQGSISRVLKTTLRFGKLQEEVKVYRRKASSRLAALEEAAEGRTASYQREIFHLQKLLSDRLEAEEKMLQSTRDVEEELELVWRTAKRENLQMKETLLDSGLVGKVSAGGGRRSLVQPEEGEEEDMKSGPDLCC